MVAVTDVDDRCVGGEALAGAEFLGERLARDVLEVYEGDCGHGADCVCCVIRGSRCRCESSKEALGGYLGVEVLQFNMLLQAVLNETWRTHASRNWWFGGVVGHAR